MRSLRMKRADDACQAEASDRNREKLHAADEAMQGDLTRERQQVDQETPRRAPEIQQEPSDGERPRG